MAEANSSVIGFEKQIWDAAWASKPTWASRTPTPFSPIATPS